MTAEGRAVAAALDRVGIWKIAGMPGTIVGLDLSEAVASLDASLDLDLARRLLITAEAHYLAAFYETRGGNDGA